MIYPQSNLLALVILFGATVAYGQGDVRLQKITKFLQTDREVQTETNEWQFTGKFMPIPELLQNDLLIHFPNHHFSLAEMNFCGHPPCRPYPLIVIAEAQSGDGKGFIRHLNWGTTSKSFSRLFDGYKAKDKVDLENKLVALGKLIAQTDERGEVGTANFKKGIMSVELKWGSRPWRVLEARTNNKFQITKMTLVNANKYKGFF